MPGRQRNSEYLESLLDKQPKDESKAENVSDEAVTGTAAKVTNSLSRIAAKAEGVVWTSSESLGGRRTTGPDGKRAKPDFYTVGRAVVTPDEFTAIYMDIDNPNGKNDTGNEVFDYQGYKVAKLTEVALQSSVSGAEIIFDRNDGGGWDATYQAGTEPSTYYSEIYGSIIDSTNEN